MAWSRLALLVPLAKVSAVQVHLSRGVSFISRPAAHASRWPLLLFR
jgi:hypothetical protein